MWGYNTNALYLQAIMQRNQKEYFCTYQEEENFKPLPPRKYGLLSYQWLSWEEHHGNIQMQHKFNGGEARMTTISFPVDGKAGNQVFQYHGSVFHRFNFCWANKNCVESLKKCNWYGDEVDNLRKDTLKITKKIEEDGYKVISIWECE